MIEELYSLNVDIKIYGDGTSFFQSRSYDINNNQTSKDQIKHEKYQRKCNQKSERRRTWKKKQRSSLIHLYH